jgi:hypothetical protein
MSISPKTKEEEVFRPSLASKATLGAKNLTKEFFISPGHYLFWGTLTALTVTLFFNVTVSPYIYAILLGLGLYEIFKKTVK